MKTANVNVINELRKKVANLERKTYSLNQAAKALSGIGTDAEKEVLGVKTFSLAEIKAAWSTKLMIDGEMGLYMTQPYTMLVEEKEVRLFERTEGKKGVSFRALSVRRLQKPEKWTPAIILEGLVQSRFPDLAAEEAADTFKHVNDVDVMYRKVTKKDANGFMSVTFEEVDAE